MSSPISLILVHAITNGPHPEQRGASRAFVEGRMGSLAALPALALDRPADAGAVGADMAVEQDLLSLLRRARAGIDSLAHAEHPALRAQSPLAAVRQQQDDRVALGLQRRRDGGMEVEAHDEAAAGSAGERILAAEIVAVSGEKKLPPMGQTEFRLVAVMRRGGPEIAAALGALMRDRARRRDERAIGAE